MLVQRPPVGDRHIARRADEVYRARGERDAQPSAEHGHQSLAPRLAEVAVEQAQMRAERQRRHLECFAGDSARLGQLRTGLDHRVKGAVVVRCSLDPAQANGERSNPLREAAQLCPRIVLDDPAAAQQRDVRVHRQPTVMMVRSPNGVTDAVERLAFRPYPERGADDMAGIGVRHGSLPDTVTGGARGNSHWHQAPTPGERFNYLYLLYKLRTGTAASEHELGVRDVQQVSDL